MGRLRIGRNLGGGNPGDTVSVRLPNGEVVQAKAATAIDKAKVLVATDEAGKHYAYAEGEGGASVTTRQITRQRPRRKPVDPDNDYFFKVLQADGLIEGFDDDVDLDLTGYTAIGVTNTGDGYVAVLKNGNTYKILSDEIRTITTNANNYINGLPSFKYVGFDNLYFWRRLNPVRTVESSSASSGEGGSILPTTNNWLTSFILPRTEPIPHLYRTPSSFITPPFIVFVESTVYNGTPSTFTFKYEIGNTQTFLNFTASSNLTSSVDNSPVSGTYSASWSGSYNEKDEYGYLENIAVNTYNYSCNGGGSGNFIAYFDQITSSTGETDYASSNGAESSSCNVDCVNVENENNHKIYEYNASHSVTQTARGSFFTETTRGIYGDTVRDVYKKETYDTRETIPNVHFKNDFIAITEKTIIKKKYECEYTEDYSAIALLPGFAQEAGYVNSFSYLYTTNKRCVTTTTFSPDDVKLLTIEIDNTSYNYGSYQNDTYTWTNSFYIASNTTIESNTTNNIAVNQISVSFDSVFPYYSKKIKIEILTGGQDLIQETNINGNVSITNTPVNEDAYEYYEQSSFTPSGDIDIYTKQPSGLFLKYTGVILSETHSNNTNSADEEWVTYTSITVTVTEPTETTFINSDNNTIIIPSNDYNEWVWHNIKNYISQCNIYKTLDEQGNEVVELAISQVPTETAEQDEWYADIYRFNTTSLKWERRPNGVSALSELTSPSDFISYREV